MNNILLKTLFRDQLKILQSGAVRFVTEASLYRPKKTKYAFQYKVRVINPDGSSYITRHHEPLGVIRLPIDPKTLTEQELKARHKRTVNAQKIQIPEYKEEVKFNRRSVMRLLRKKDKN